MCVFILNETSVDGLHQVSTSLFFLSLTLTLSLSLSRPFLLSSVYPPLDLVSNHVTRLSNSFGGVLSLPLLIMAEKCNRPRFFPVG